MDLILYTLVFLYCERSFKYPGHMLFKILYHLTCLFILSVYLFILSVYVLILSAYLTIIIISHSYYQPVWPHHQSVSIISLFICPYHLAGLICLSMVTDLSQCCHSHQLSQCCHSHQLSQCCHSHQLSQCCYSHQLSRCCHSHVITVLP